MFFNHIDKRIRHFLTISINLNGPTSRYGTPSKLKDDEETKGKKIIMKKQLLKNLYAVFLAGFMALLLLPQAAQAQSTEPYVVKSSDKKTLTFYYDNKISSRTGTAWGLVRTQIESGFSFPIWSGTWTKPETEVTTVIFDASFKNYRPKNTKCWFLNITNLETIKGIENLNTSEVTTMRSMFEKCEKLSTLNLSNFNTENVQNMEDMFEHCHNLTSLNLSSFDTKNVTTMRGMFTHCHNLTSLNISSFNTENVTNMSAMFYECEKLASLDLSKFNTKNVNLMSSMFYKCHNLTSLNISSFNTEQVIYMNLMFSACQKLSSIDVSSFKTKNVKSMEGMFSGCSSLTSLDLSYFSTENMKEMQSMFDGCKSLQTIYCNNTWACEQSSYMFYDCTKLKGAVKYDASKVDVSMANPNTGYFTKKKVSGVTTITNSDASIQTIYSTDGKRLNELQRGLNIVRMSNGTTQKILRK
ncbi:hypothetical protein HMPREF9332_01082 [Alloprevotella rava F0323]|uniref:BspA family leucine-rich repeat surface protein n=2 Tax=Alloprevotella rava TaxID=671218 RepID=G5GBY1_9BACT|nr:hypothetical protein HMPREF9332_01082 [Alloprevotella rava F0323]